MQHLYGEFTDNQIHEEKIKLRKSIFWLILYVDPKTKTNYNVDVNHYFVTLMKKIGGMNELLYTPPELVSVLGLLETAYIELNKDDFDFTKSIYRNLILDAGDLVLKIKEGD